MEKKKLTFKEWVAGEIVATKRGSNYAGDTELQ